MKLVEGVDKLNRSPILTWKKCTIALGKAIMGSSWMQMNEEEKAPNVIKVETKLGGR